MWQSWTFCRKNASQNGKNRPINGQKIDIFEFIEKFGHVVFDLTF